MGLDVSRGDFSAQDFEYFAARLARDIEAMRGLFAGPGWLAGTHRIGAELELHLVDQLLWHCGRSLFPSVRAADELALSLLPTAAKGPLHAGGDEKDFAPLLAIIEARAKIRQTGSAWQRARFARYSETHPPDRALAMMLRHYLAL